MNSLRQLARQYDVKMPPHVTKIALAQLLECKGIDTSQYMATVARGRNSSPKLRTRSPAPKARAAPKARVAPKEKAAPKAKAAPGWEFLAQGRDGSVYVKGTEIKKVFTSSKKAALENKFTRLMTGSGVTPEIISYDGNCTLIMTKVDGVSISKYMAGLGKGTQAPLRVQRSFIEMLQKISEHDINPNDNNLENFLVDAVKGKVWRIDLGGAKIDTTHKILDCFSLASKIYTKFPLVIEFLQATMWVPDVWRAKFGYA
jgi:predicted Ser/Thr protein kinase